MKTTTERVAPLAGALLTGFAAFTIPLCAGAQTPGDIANAARTGAQQDQRNEQQRESGERERTVNAPAVRSAAPVAGAYPDLPTEQPCFRVNRFTLDVPSMLPEAVRSQGASALPQDRFAFAREWLSHYSGACIGRQGVELIVKGASQLILSRGYITTRVLVPEQDLSGGELKLTLVPGVIRQLRFADPATRGTWKSAFPTRGGDLLNLRDLEQGLEQMKRVASQDVDMQIEPSDAPGESDVVITVKRTKPWTVVASVDNSGTRATGKLQGNLSVGLDNPLGLNDMLNVGASQDLELGDKQLGSHGWNAFYSIPYGYWTATISGNTSTYYQQIAGANQTFVSSGNSQNLDFRLQRVIHRSQNDVSGLQFRLTKRFGANFIDDTEIPQQRRDNTFIEAGLTNRHYYGAAQFDGSLAYRQGIGWLGATPDTSAQKGGPTYRFHMAVLDANLSVPFSIARQNLRYVTTVHGQFTNDTLFFIDDLTIGSRYTVRGFDGETMLASERGFYWRNELQMPIGQTGQSVYAGIDYGHVYGASTAFLAGTQLAGAVVGLRGSVSSRFGAYSYDLFAGTPIYKPATFDTARVTFGFQMTAQF